VLDVELDMDRAIPCGLVINELVSNAIKYAFPEGRRGTVRVACSRDSDGFISLKVSDNGVGMPKGLDFRRTETMGLQIVNLLTRQLQGKIETLDVDGTAFIIAFPGEACGRRGDRSAVAGKS
jgi:two-component sensor histidine kinase